jgi:hypothetical protein
MQIVRFKDLTVQIIYRTNFDPMIVESPPLPIRESYFFGLLVERKQDMKITSTSNENLKRSLQMRIFYNSNCQLVQLLHLLQVCIV